MQLSKRARYALIALGFVIGAVVAGPVMGAILDNTAPVSGGVPIAAPNGPTATLQGSTNVSLDDPSQTFPDANTVVLYTKAGNVTLESSGPTNATIDASNITGSSTYVSDLDVASNELTIDTEDKESVTVGGDAETLLFKDTVAADDGTVDFEYSGPSGTTTLTIRNAPASTTLAAVDANSNAVLDVASSDSNGNVTYSLPNSAHSVTLQTTSGGPSLANPDPTGKVTSSPTQLSIDVSDPDFPGDNVSVTIDYEGSQVHQEYVTSNTTVTTSISKPALGNTYSWSVEATDEYGQTTTDSYTFSTPGNLTFRNETQPTQVVTGVNATIYSVDGELVKTLVDSDGDGEINLTGLPDKEYVIAMEKDEFYDRRAYLADIYEQNQLFLLNSTAYPLDPAEAVFTEFTLTDRTGDFPAGNTTLRVQRALNLTGGNVSDWYTVAGDRFGATNRFPFTGEYQTRYRLVVENQEGQRRVLGSYTPTVGGTQEVEIGKVTFSAEVQEGVAFQASAFESSGSRYLQLVAWSGETEATDVEYRVVRADNESNVIISNTTTALGSQETVITRNLSALDTGAPDDQAYKVEWTIIKPNEANVSGVAYAGTLPPWGFGINSTVLNLIGWVGLIAFAGFTALRSPKMSAISTPVMASGLTMFDILNIPWVFLILAGAMGVIYTLGERMGR